MARIVPNAGVARKKIFLAADSEEKQSEIEIAIDELMAQYSPDELYRLKGSDLRVLVVGYLVEPERRLVLTLLSALNPSMSPSLDQACIDVEPSRVEKAMLIGTPKQELAFGHIFNFLH